MDGFEKIVLDGVADFKVHLSVAHRYATFLCSDAEIRLPIPNLKNLVGRLTNLRAVWLARPITKCPKYLCFIVF